MSRTSLACSLERHNTVRHGARSASPGRHAAPVQPCSFAGTLPFNFPENSNMNGQKKNLNAKAYYICLDRERSDDIILLRPEPAREAATAGGAHRHPGLRHPEGDLAQGRPRHAAPARQLQERTNEYQCSLHWFNFLDSKRNGVTEVTVELTFLPIKPFFSLHVPLF